MRAVVFRVQVVQEKPGMQAAELTQLLKAEAQRQGFALAGACPAVEPAGFSRLRAWLAAGRAGEMRYLQERLEAYAHPRHVLDGVRSLLMLAMNYRTVERQPSAPGHGRVSSYAWGSRDYHDVLQQRLEQLAGVLRRHQPGALVRGVVDTAPLLEREFAQLAGLGWIGKNTLLINPRRGSWLFLAALLTDQVLAYDSPHVTDHCGNCRACLDACPTGAFPEPHVLDATRCISYWTIEARSLAPPDLRPAIGDWLFGCDVCQEVCPWNRHAPAGDEPAFVPAAGMDPAALGGLFSLSDDDFRARFRRTPLARAKRRGLLRNAAIVLGNQPATVATHKALQAGLEDREPLVREASAWALSHLEERPRDRHNDVHPLS